MIPTSVPIPFRALSRVASAVALTIAASASFDVVLGQVTEGRVGMNLTGIPQLDAARRAQADFEQFRRANLPQFQGRVASGERECEAQVGRFCYWYEESEQAEEPAQITSERKRLITLLDGTAAEFPADDWTSGQRVRYLIEANEAGKAIAAALACRGEPWWCGALAGLAYHEARQYASADSAFRSALGQMTERMRCDWSDAGILLDDYTGRAYRRTTCGTPSRALFEERLWFLSKPLYATPGMDTRSEYLSRVTMTHILRDAPNVHQYGFDLDERELTLRYGWPRSWSRQNASRAEGGISVIGHERTPAYQFLPPALVANNPAISDSADWENGMPPIHARYSAAHALRVHPLPHQSALFRRGDSALVVVSWDASARPVGVGLKREMAVVLARGDSLKPVITRLTDAPLRGVMTAKGPWGQLIFSAELTAAGYDSASRARYGLRPPYAIGARVTLSEMLFFAPYDGLPNTLEEAVPHAVPTMRVRTDRKLGVYFETYGTKLEGEMLNVTVTIGREEGEPGFMRRRLQQLGLSGRSEPVSVTHEALSRSGSTTTPRAVYLDISTLKKGSYIVQIEVNVAGQYSVRSERTIDVIN